MRIQIYLLLPFLLFSCKKKTEKTKPTIESISESIYASGIIKSNNQYQAYSKVNGVIEEIFVSEGDYVKKGQTILVISNDAQRLNKENAQLAESFSDISANQGKLKEAKISIELSKNKMKNDSALYFRQIALYNQNIGSKVELEQKELAYQNSKSTFFTSVLKYDELNRQLEFNSSQTKKNLLLSNSLESDFTLKSEIDGVIYSLTKNKGEIINTQSPIAIIGDSKEFILEMQVDEYDILKIKKGQLALISLDSYKGKVFEATITKINPLMNERSKTFTIEASFNKMPETLYPNISFEANIIIQTKPKAILIPRNYLLNDSIVIKSNGDSTKIKTGLKDYRKIEIISGINENDELTKPTE